MLLPEQGSPIVRGRRLAAELRRLRERTGLTGDEVASELGWSGSKISRIELHRIGIKQADLRRLLDLYAVEEPHRGELQALARESAQRGAVEGWSIRLTEEMSDYLAAEAEARQLLNWEPQIVPGLLQSEGYARALLQGAKSIFRLSPGDVEGRVAARMARQQLLTREHPLELSVVMDESVLHRCFGTRSVMCNQLELLVQRSRWANMEIRVLALTGQHPIGTGSFTYMTFPQVHEVPLADTVFMEQLVTNYRIEDEQVTSNYRVAFEHLKEQSLTLRESRKMIERVAKTLWK